LVKVLDLAGNSVEDDLEFETLPLPTPTVDFIIRAVSQGELVFASGKAIPNGFVDVKVFNKEGQEVFADAAETDGSGNWKINIEEALPTGKYTLVVSARDERGAISYPTEPEDFKIRAKTILSIGFVDLGWFEILLIIILLTVSGTSVAAWYYTTTKRKREAYKIIAGRDIDKLSTLLANDVKELEAWFKNIPGIEPRTKEESNFLFQKIKETIAKMKKYLGQELEKLR